MNRVVPTVNEAVVLPIVADLVIIRAVGPLAVDMDTATGEDPPSEEAVPVVAAMTATVAVSTIIRETASMIPRTGAAAEKAAEATVPAEAAARAAEAGVLTRAAENGEDFIDPGR